MPLSRKPAKQPNSMALKQAANWQCTACGRQCRHHDESLDDFASRVDHDVDEIAAHPRRWTLHVTQVDAPVVSPVSPQAAARNAAPAQPVAVLCGSCHRTHHNYRRRQQRQRQHRQQQEHLGQLTLSDIRLPLTGLQLSLSEWTSPYEIVNPLPPRRRMGAP